MSTVLIDTNYDGDIDYDALAGTYTKNDTAYIMLVGGYRSYDKVGNLIEDRRIRSYARYPLNGLPANVTAITQVRLHLYLDAVGGASHLTDVHAYDTNGQTDPQPDNGATLYGRCASGNLYLNDDPSLRGPAGWYWLTLGGTVCDDILAAKSAVNRFSLALHEEGDNDSPAYIRTLEWGSLWTQLEITYEAPPPPWGGDTHHVQMAKAILGAYLPWSKRFPKLTPRIV